MGERSHGVMAERLLSMCLRFHVSVRLWRANDRETFLFVERERGIDLHHSELYQRRHEVIAV
jgi:hypothetical protein